MEPTLHCARPGLGLRGALLRPRARVPLLLPTLEPEARRHRRLQDAAAGGDRMRRGRHVRQAADRPARRTWAERDGYVYINGKQLTSRTSSPTGATRRRSRPIKIPPGPVLHDGRQPRRLLRLAPVGDGAAEEPDRQGDRDLLAAAPDLGSVARGCESSDRPFDVGLTRLPVADRDADRAPVVPAPCRPAMPRRSSCTRRRRGRSSSSSSKRSSTWLSTTSFRISQPGSSRERRRRSRVRARSVRSTVGDAGAAERAERGVDREAARAARMLRRPVDRVARRRSAWIR